MKALDSPFDSAPRISGSSKSNFLNTNMHFFNKNKISNNCSSKISSFLFNSCGTKASSTVFCNNTSKNVLLKVPYTNIRSILNKISFVECYMCTKKVDLFLLTETWLTPNIIDSNFCPLGYNIIRNDRKSRGEALLLFLKTL